MAITEVRSETDVKTVQANFAELDARNDGVTASEAELNVLDGIAPNLSAAELSILDGVTSNALELNLLDGSAAGITTTATPATGTVGVQFVFKQADGSTNITVPFSGFGYICTAADGLTSKSVTSVAALTNGRVLNIPTVTSLFQFTSTAAGLLGLTITGSTGDYYVAFIIPGGKIVVSSVCHIN